MPSPDRALADPPQGFAEGLRARLRDRLARLPVTQVEQRGGGDEATGERRSQLLEIRLPLDCSGAPRVMARDRASCSLRTARIVRATRHDSVFSIVESRPLVDVAVRVFEPLDRVLACPFEPIAELRLVGALERLIEGACRVGEKGGEPACVFN